MFAPVPSEESGVATENRYADPKMWGALNRQFEVGAIGTGIAVGDFDNDGRPDIFVVSKTESCRLFRNLGGWKFAEVSRSAGVEDKGQAAGVWKQGAAFVDVNNDGWLDIYVCRFNAPNLLYLNRRDGTFSECAAEAGLAVNDASNMAAFCDYDRDGWLDLYLQTNYKDASHPDGRADYLFHNNRDGTFTDVTRAAGISGEGYGHSATWWDYNEDGWPDVYVANDFAAPDRLYRNNRDGTFTNVIDQVVPHLPFSAMGADLGDVNNDGRIDLLVAEMAATTHEKDLRGMAESRSRARDPIPGATEPPQYFHNALYLNTGKGRCLEAAFLSGLAATDWTWSIRFEDLDNDGHLDLHVTNGMFREIHNTEFLQRRLSAENEDERIRFTRTSPVLAEDNLAFRNCGDLQFESVGAEWGLNEKGVSFGAAFGDFDGDGDLDLVYANYERGVTLLRNDSDQGHRLIVRLRGTKANRFGIGAVVRIETKNGPQVRALISSRGYLSTSEPSVHFGLGDADRIIELSVDWPSGAKSVYQNLEADGVLTITETSGGSEQNAEAVAVVRSQFAERSVPLGLALRSRDASVDELATEPLLPMRHSRVGPAIAVGDIDGDGRDEIVVGGTALDPLRILHRAAGEEFMSQDLAPTMPAVNADGPILIFDANGDGRNDLFVTKSGTSASVNGSNEPHFFISDGEKGFRAADPGTLPSFASSVGAAAAGDFDRDGALDIFIGGRVLPGEYPLAPQSAVWLNRAGKFVDVTEQICPALRQIGMVTAALWTDVDGDGRLDLLVALEWGNVRYFHNREGHTLEDWSERSGFTQAGSGWWTSLAAADFNGDGRLDYVAGNVGLNTPYRASPTEPALIYYGQFGEDRPPEIVEAEYANGRVVPRRVRRQLSLRLPSVLKKFPSNDRFARASIDEIISPDHLNDATVFRATNFSSGVFLSQPDGSFRFSALPRMAQIAPLQGTVAGDLDGDGRADIYAVQNSFSPAPSIGRFDGGLSVFLRGDGKGNFTPVDLAKSGLLVTGDAKALAICDFNDDGWPDFFVSRNDDTSVAFVNQTVVGRRSLCVRLRGLKGNVAGIGALIRCEYSDGSSQIAEVHAGSGYFSQSSPSAFFGFGPQKEIKNISVRWPDGQTTLRTTKLGDGSSLTLEQTSDAR